MTHPIDPRDVPFMVSIEQSEMLLRAIDRGHEPPCSAEDLRRVQSDALKAIARDMPDPLDFAMGIQGPLAQALVGAEQGLDREICGAWCIAASSTHLLSYLRSMGLVHVKHRTLTDFGVRVRAELMKDEQ